MNKLSLFAIIILGVLSALSCATCNEAPEVAVKQGHLRGKFMKTRKGREFSAFMSIPYAEPPLGELRFEPPVSGKSWKGVRNADKVHAICPQRNIYTRSDIVEGEEDCLYLNVYTPQKHNSETKKYPVMVFVHGGGWLSGAGNADWYGPEVLLDKDIVLVVTNYRLAALGFLSTGDEVVPGNMGLKDQNLALRWTKDNVHVFGGDPNSVTVFGESAGGVSAHLHTISPLSKGLIHGSISQSGNALVYWGIKPKGVVSDRSKYLGQLFNCPTDSSKELVNCLRNIDPLEIIAQDRQYDTWDRDPMIPFSPVVEYNHDGAFLVEEPVDAIKGGRAPHCPWVTGVTTEDGALRAPGIYGTANLVEELDRDFDRIIPSALYYELTSKDVTAITKKIRKFYFGDKKIDASSRFDVVDLFTDGWFFAPADEAVRLHLKYSKYKTYYYLFGHHGVASFSQLFGDPKNRYGSIHADDLQYLFPMSDNFFPDQPPDLLDQRMAEIMTTLWTNFATYKDPTPEVNSLIHDKWEPVTTEDHEFFYIGGGVHNGKNMFSERARFWRSLPIHSASKPIRDEL